MPFESIHNSYRIESKYKSIVNYSRFYVTESIDWNRENVIFLWLIREIFSSYRADNIADSKLQHPPQFKYETRLFQIVVVIIFIVVVHQEMAAVEWMMIWAVGVIVAWWCLWRNATHDKHYKWTQFEIINNTIRQRGAHSLGLAWSATVSPSIPWIFSIDWYIYVVYWVYICMCQYNIVVVNSKQFVLVRHCMGLGMIFSHVNNE